jgi:adenylate kinase family enzyme
LLAVLSFSTKNVVNLCNKKKSIDMTNIGFTLATGSRACGKTTLLKLICNLAHCGGVVFEDTSNILDLHRKRETKIGIELKKYDADRANGKILPDELAFEAVTQWIHAKQEFQELKHILLAGSPRGVKQSQLWKQFAGQNIRVLHIPTTLEQIERSVAQRQVENGEVRSDETVVAINNAWSEYQNKVVPGLKVFNGHVLDLPRQLSMRNRLERAIEHMAINDQVRHRWMRRLNTPTHPVSRRVDELDGVVRH